MTRITHRVRRAALGLVVLTPLALTACDLEDNLLEPQQPGVIKPEDIASAGATGAVALYTGALGALKNWTCGGPAASNNSQSICMYSDLMTDVWETSDTFQQRIDMDRRVVQSNDVEVTGRYATIQQSRGYMRDAINSLRANDPTEPERQADMYFALGYTEMSLGEYFCNGIPLTETVNGVPQYDKDIPLTNVEVWNRALAHLDSAITLASGTNALAVRAINAAKIARGRALIDLGRFADAAAAVQGVATSYQYALTYSLTTSDNAVWVNNGNASAPASARYVVGDSAALSQGVETRIRNAIPFASANDPRVPTTGTFKTSTTRGFDGTTPYVGARAFADRSTPTVIASGIDARLIEAEARLQANDIPGMIQILNALRSASQNLGGITYAANALPALTAPTTQTAATDLFFREKAFWQFARGTRLGDLRRLIRQYNRTEDQVFPEGGFHKPPFAFGDDVNFPVPDSEFPNPNFKGCIDRKA